jgi:hypothetical protein
MCHSKALPATSDMGPQSTTTYFVGPGWNCGNSNAESSLSTGQYPQTGYCSKQGIQITTIEKLKEEMKKMVVHSSWGSTLTADLSFCASFCA